jgi:hypothetical protein
VLFTEDPARLQHNVRGMTFLPSIWKRVLQPAMQHFRPGALIFAMHVAVRGLAREPATDNDREVFRDVGQMPRVAKLREAGAGAVLALFGGRELQTRQQRVDVRGAAGELVAEGCEG